MKSIWIVALLFSSVIAIELGRPKPSFDFFNTDADDKITKEEFEENRINWSQLKISSKEGLTRKMDVTMTFYDLDTNGDGIITREEFNAHQSDTGWGCYDTF